MGRVSRTISFVLYRKSVKRVLLCAVLLILFADASGAMALVSPETCTASETAPDNTCPPLCVRCGCCAQPVVLMVGLALTSVQAVSSPPATYVASPRLGSPHEILHVPK